MNNLTPQARTTRSGTLPSIKTTLAACFVTLLMGMVSTAKLNAQSTAFTYQGKLTADGSPARGSYELKFTLHNVASGGSVVAGPVTNSPVTISNGLFTLSLEFGSAVFTSEDRWLEMSVRSHGGGMFTPLRNAKSEPRSKPQSRKPKRRTNDDRTLTTENRIERNL